MTHQQLCPLGEPIRSSLGTKTLIALVPNESLIGSHNGQSCWCMTHPFSLSVYISLVHRVAQAGQMSATQVATSLLQTLAQAAVMQGGCCEWSMLISVFDISADHSQHPSSTTAACASVRQHTSTSKRNLSVISQDMDSGYLSSLPCTTAAVVQGPSRPCSPG